MTINSIGPGSIPPPDPSRNPLDEASELSAAEATSTARPLVRRQKPAEPVETFPVTDTFVESNDIPPVAKESAAAQSGVDQTTITPEQEEEAFKAEVGESSEDFLPRPTRKEDSRSKKTRSLIGAAAGGESDVSFQPQGVVAPIVTEGQINAYRIMAEYHAVGDKQKDYTHTLTPPTIEEFYVTQVDDLRKPAAKASLNFARELLFEPARPIGIAEVARNSVTLMQGDEFPTAPIIGAKGERSYFPVSVAA